MPRMNSVYSKCIYSDSTRVGGRY